MVISLNVHNVFFIIFTRFASAGAIFISSLLAMHYLSPERFAEYGYLYTVYSAFVLIPTIGILNTMVINYDQAKFVVKESNFYRCFVIVIALCLVSTLYVVGVVNIVFLSAASCGLIASGIDFKMAVFQSKKKFKKYGLLMPARSGLYMISVSGAFFLFLDSKDLFLYIYIFLMGLVLSASLFIGRHLDVRPKLKIEALIKTIRGASSFYIYEIGALIMMRTEIWLLNYYATNGDAFSKKDVGSYMSAYTVVFAIPIITSSLMALMMPYVKSRNFSQGFRNKKNVMLMVLGFAGFVVIYGVAASFLIDVFYAQKFPGSKMVIWLLLGGMWASFLAGVVRLAIINSQNEKATNWVTLSQVVVSVLLGLFLIPKYGIYGAGCTFALVRAYALMGFLLQLFKGRRNEVYS
ncbi:hypothetical protein MLD55_08590 [Alcanivorax sp. MM125-6]|nr:hypothetical protein [Alcanivorax sp. MM125-6]